MKNISTETWVTLIMVNIIPLIANILVTLYYLAKQRTHDQNLLHTTEKLKHELQREFCKAEFKTRNIFQIYPELFAKFKRTEMEFRYVFGGSRINPTVLPFEEDRANKLFAEAAEYFLTNLLFYSPAVREAGMKLKNSLNACVVMQNIYKDLSETSYKHEKSELKQKIGKCCTQSEELIDALEKVMKNELDTETPIDKEEP